MQSLISEVSSYVLGLLTNKLPVTLSFHNIAHTLDVVEGVKEICLYTGISTEQSETVQIAAWFHDTGYLKKYIGHEEESIQIAKQFFTAKGVSIKRVEEIVGCINATKYPQNPLNFLEKVICDADFYHFSLPDYPVKSNLLRAEWELYLRKFFTDDDWKKENCSMLTGHKYFTAYGQSTLQLLKDANLEMIRSYCK
ncbi:MAG: hypothetical protein JWN56_841 [Sphingobacteriales bacterium]|nr:hypothetical protein [Sphingobacteriales bacterium]